METFLGVTAAPGRTRCRPLTTIMSPERKPSRTTRSPSVIGPSFTGRYSRVLFFPRKKPRSQGQILIRESGAQANRPCRRADLIVHKAHLAGVRESVFVRQA